MKAENHKKIITRFAPSPTGNLHIGGFRTALFNYLYAKHHDGKVILRIEDTDKERSKPEYEKNIFEGLEWLGMEFDEIFRQSERTSVYSHYLSKLIASGQAYVSKESAADVAEGKRESVIRFKNPNTVINFYDLIRGEISFDTTELGDFIIAKSDTEPLYHFAVVVDDHEMAVTHVIRGEEHISNTPRQILMGRALGAIQPVYAHLPLILAPDKTKLSKRKGAMALTDYKGLGYLPEALTNYMAFLGWNPGTEEELFTLGELVKRFDVANVQKAGAVYNETKLRWVNREYLKRKPHVEIATEIRSFIDASTKLKENKWHIDDALLMKIMPVLIDRIDVYSDLTKQLDAGEFDYLFEATAYDPKDMIWRDEKDPEKTKEFLKEVIGILDSANEDQLSDSEKVKSLIWNYATEHGRGAVLWPIRFALTGKNKSPDPFTLISILGKKESLKRLKQAEKVLN